MARGLAFLALCRPVDALVSAGFKWLCGPYGTGFCWISRQLRERLEPPKAYWLSMLTQEDLARPLDVRLKTGLGVRAFDVFGTANFFNFVAWTASLELLLERGVEAATGIPRRRRPASTRSPVRASSSRCARARSVSLRTSTMSPATSSSRRRS
jgi:hypothetical protein